MTFINLESITRKIRWRNINFWWALRIIIVGLFLIWLLMIVPIVQVSPFREELTPNEFVTQINDYRRTIAQIIGGIGLLIGLWLTWRRIRATERNVEVAQEGQITERFTRAVEQLGNENLDVRLGGIYALERIAKDSKKDHPQIMEILTAFVREHAPLKKIKSDGKGESSRSSIKTDVQAVLIVIGRRNVDYDREGQRLDLSDTNLYRANLRGANLQGALLIGSNLQEAMLHKANLNTAELDEATLMKANLREANLQEAELHQVNLKGSILIETNLKKTSLTKANLQDSVLIEANLQKAKLHLANLQDATLILANLQGAFLWEANLSKANLGEANLQEANLREANLQDITGWDTITNITGANIYGITNAPEGFVEFAKSKGAIEKER